MRDLFGSATTAGRRRTPTVLLCLAGLAIAGYFGAQWTMSDEPVASPARGMASVAVLAEPSGAVSPPPGGREPVQPDDHPPLGIVSGLELTGVLMSGRASIAIIADAGGREKVYRIGDQIRAGVTLAEVSRNGAVVARGDLRQRLPLTVRAAAPGSGPAVSLRAEVPAAATPSTPGAGAVPRRRANFGLEVRKQGVVVPDPGGGFQLRKVMPDSVYERMGLRGGDVLRSANGRPIESSEQLTLLYQQANEGGQGSVELMRKGRLEVLQFGGR